jgi:hypothetical protein
MANWPNDTVEPDKYALERVAVREMQNILNTHLTNGTSQLLAIDILLATFIYKGQPTKQLRFKTLKTHHANVAELLKGIEESFNV